MTAPTAPATTAADDAQTELEREQARARARELVTVRHTPTDRNLADVAPYTFECTRKAWQAGVYPAAEGFALVPTAPAAVPAELAGLTDEERRQRAIEEARRIVAEEDAAEAKRAADAEAKRAAAEAKKQAAAEEKAAAAAAAATR